ncbi:hypothetical protein TNCV_5053261 [Trichonephila clavipes]|nr:hypothetical protein TNCV_5053261 [Trichonephila clavipes]
MGDFDSAYSRRAASSLVRLVEEEARWEEPDNLLGVLPQNSGVTAPFAGMNFVDLDGTSSDRWHYGQQQHQIESDRGSLVVKVTDSCDEFEPSTAEDTPCKGELMHEKYVEA